LQIKEDYQKKFEERMKNISKNLSYENSLRERNHLSRLERKIDEIADFEDYFLRARSRIYDVDKNYRSSERESAIALMTEWELWNREKKFGTYVNNCHFTINHNYI